MNKVNRRGFVGTIAALLGMGAVAKAELIPVGKDADGQIKPIGEVGLYTPFKPRKPLPPSFYGRVCRSLVSGINKDVHIAIDLDRPGHQYAYLNELYSFADLPVNTKLIVQYLNQEWQVVISEKWSPAPQVLRPGTILNISQGRYYV